jgi:hypothetical protein
LSERLVVFRNRVLEFLVFFVVTAIVWSEVDFCHFLIFGKKLAGDRLLWALGCYCLVWMIGVCVSNNMERLRRMFAGSGIESLQLSVAQDPSN